MSDAQTWYVASKYDIQIDSVEITRYSDDSVWHIRSNGIEYRSNRDSSYNSFHPTFDEARDALMARLNKNVEVLESSLVSARGELELAEGLRESAS